MQIFTVDNNRDIKKLEERYNVNLDGIQFQCRTYETRNSWGHKGEAINIKTGEILASNRIRYYNRTWERYQYETILRELVKKAIKNIQKNRSNLI